jgi:hypothetical protein
MHGTEVMYDEPYVDMMQSNNEIIVPRECTGFIMTYKKFNLSDSTLNKTEHLMGVFTGGYIGTLIDMKEHCKSYNELSENGIKDDCCCILYMDDDGRKSLMPLGKNDHVVTKEDLKKILNYMIAQSISIDYIAGNLKNCGIRLMKKGYKGL